jgi:hypothetical protein
MKKTDLFIVLCCLCYGCSLEESLPLKEVETQAEEPQTYTVSLKMGGEITSEDMPLSTKAETASRDLYGVQVYRNTAYFAYGLFDNPDSIKISLLKEGTYKFVCTLVKGGKDLLLLHRPAVYYESNDSYGVSNSSYSYYREPFDVNIYNNNYSNYYLQYDVSYPMCRNQFGYTSTYRFNNLGTGTSRLTDNTTVNYPQADRYYAEVDNYTPSVNGTVTMEMKRTAFGIKCRVVDIPDGTVVVTCKNSSGTIYTTSSLGATNSETANTLITFNSVQGAWQYANNYTENVTVGVKWTRAIGITEDLGEKEIPVKRNAMNIIRISLGASDGNASIGITTESAAMGQDSEDVPLK